MSNHTLVFFVAAAFSLLADLGFSLCHMYHSISGSRTQLLPVRRPCWVSVPWFPLSLHKCTHTQVHTHTIFHFANGLVCVSNSYLGQNSFFLLCDSWMNSQNKPIFCSRSFFFCLFMSHLHYLEHMANPARWQRERSKQTRTPSERQIIVCSIYSALYLQNDLEHWLWGPGAADTGMKCVVRKWPWSRLRALRNSSLISPHRNR